MSNTDTNILDDIFSDEFYAEVKADIIIDAENLVYESLNTPIIHHKYLRKLKQHENKREDEILRHKKLVMELELYFSGKASSDAYKAKPFTLILTKTEITQHIEAHPAFAKSKRNLDLWKLRCEFLTETVKSINNRSFHLNNAIRMIRFNNGENS